MNYVKTQRIDVRVTPSELTPDYCQCPACKLNYAEFVRMNLHTAEDGVHVVARCQDEPSHTLVGVLCQDGAGCTRFQAQVFENLTQCS